MKICATKCTYNHNTEKIRRLRKMNDHKKLTSIHRQLLGDRKYQSNNIPVFKTPTIPLRRGKRKIKNLLEINHHNYNINSAINCTVVKSIVITNKHKTTTTSKSLNKRKVYKRTKYHSRHLVVTPASKMIYNLTKRTRELCEGVYNNPKRRRLDAGTFKIEPCDEDYYSFSLKNLFDYDTDIKHCTVDMSDQNENLLCTAKNLNTSEYPEKVCSIINPTLTDFKSKMEAALTKVDDYINDDYKPVLKFSPPSSPEKIIIKSECTTKIEDDTMDVKDEKPDVVVKSEIEMDDIKSDPLYKPPATTFDGQLLWARYCNFPFWPAIVCQSDMDTRKNKINVRFFADKGNIGLVNKDQIFEFRGIDSFLRYKKGMMSELNKATWKRWFLTNRTKHWTQAVVEGTFLLSKDVDIRLPLFDIIVICALRDTLKNPPTLPKLIEEHVPEDRIKSVQKMFAENPDIFEEVKRNLDEISSVVDVPSPQTVARVTSRPQTPVVPATTKPKNEMDTQRRHSAPSNMTKRRSSVRLASIVQSQLSVSQVAIDEAHLTTAIQKQEKQQRKIKNKEEKRIEFEEALELYKSTASQKDILFKGLRRGHVCKKCLTVDEKLDQDLVNCSGDCGNYVHRKCAHRSSLSNAIRCDECIDGSSHVCNACKQICTESMVRCSLKSCGRYYHNKCLENWLQTKSLESGKVNCPLHVCHHCVSDDPRNKHYVFKDTKSTHCIKCPTTFHMDSNCIPAGTKILTANQHICIRHRNVKDRKPVSLNWCYICGGRGGKFVCCDSCPLTSHESCLHIPPIAGEPHLCDSCETGRHPLYGEIVWAKYSHYRWWPSVVVPPACIPSSMKDKKPYEHDICVRFFGTYEFGWVGRSNVYLYDEDDGQKSGDAKYDEAIEQADNWYKALTTNARKSSGKVEPLPYTKIKQICQVQPAKLRKRKNSDSEPCNCSPDDPDPCGPTSCCANRECCTECDADSCPAGDTCKNQDIEKRRYAPFKLEYFGDKGFGLVADAFISKETLIIEYVGELVTEKEFQSRLRSKQTQNFYFMEYDRDRGLYIDAERKGNMARFMNHSCNPNCTTRVIIVKGIKRIGLFAIRDIEKGTELTFNYEFDDESHKCYCGENNCRGVIGRKVGTRGPSHTL